MTSIEQKMKEAIGEAYPDFTLSVNENIDQASKNTSNIAREQALLFGMFISKAHINWSELKKCWYAIYIHDQPTMTSDEVFDMYLKEQHSLTQLKEGEK